MVDLHTLPVDGLYRYPQGVSQINREKRYDQMAEGTILEWRVMSAETLRPVQTGKFFKIQKIEPGYCDGIPDWFNGYILVLKRVK